MQNSLCGFAVRKVYIVIETQTEYGVNPVIIHTHKRNTDPPVDRWFYPNSLGMCAAASPEMLRSNETMRRH